MTNNLEWHRKFNDGSAKDIKKLTLFVVRLTIDKICSENMGAPDVTYLLVNIRKLLESDRRYSFPLINFYCDWMVHVRKDRITLEMSKVAVKFENPKYVKKMLLMEDLRREMQKFLTKYHLNVRLTKNAKVWKEFCSMFAGTLLEQPLFRPTARIEYICFRWSDLGLGIEIKRIINGKKQRAEAYLIEPIIDIWVKKKA